MATLTLTVDDDFRKEIKALSWINWSEIARKEVMKKLIFENFMKTGKLDDDEWEFCEKIDWHPVDEIHLKKGFARKLSGFQREKSKKLKNISEIFK